MHGANSRLRGLRRPAQGVRYWSSKMRGTRCSGCGWVRRVYVRAGGRAIMGVGSASCGNMSIQSSRYSVGQGGTTMSRCVSQSIFRLGEGKFSVLPHSHFLSSSLPPTSSLMKRSDPRDGQYGLYLDESLLDGSTARCLTFENDPLCTPGPMTGGTVKFECVGLEVWSIGP